MKPNDYGAILWDNDGVLVDTERWYFEATREVLAKVGVVLTVQLYFEYFLVRSGGAWHLAAAAGASEADIAALREERNLRYQRLLETEAITVTGVRETLETLRPHFVMGIVTSSRRAHFETIHRRTGLLELFDFTLTLEDYARPKPAPDPYVQAIARSGLPSHRCLAIEDAPRGLTAARAARLDCWVIPTEYTRFADFSTASRTLATVTDVLSILS